MCCGIRTGDTGGGGGLAGAANRVAILAGAQRGVLGTDALGAIGALAGAADAGGIAVLTNADFLVQGAVEALCAVGEALGLVQVTGAGGAGRSRAGAGQTGRVAAAADAPVHEECRAARKTVRLKTPVARLT